MVIESVGNSKDSLSTLHPDGQILSENGDIELPLFRIEVQAQVDQKAMDEREQRRRPRKLNGEESAKLLNMLVAEKQDLHEESRRIISMLKVMLMLLGRRALSIPC